jgi:plastocyanin
MRRSRPSWRAARAVVLGIGLLLAVAAIGCGGSSSEPPPPPPGAIPAGESIGTAAITGHAVFHGTPPPRKPVKMSESVCRHPEGPPLSQEVIVNADGTLRNVYVHVVSGLGDRVFAPPAEPAEMDQAGCMFVPHVLTAQTDQIVVFKNSDPTVHNVRAIAEKNRTFNVSMSGQGRSVRRFFSSPEIVRIRCDIHAWMSGYVAIDDHPFRAVTGDDGAFALQGLPAGTYTVEAWQESFGPRRQTVTLADGERRDLTFVFGE